MSLLIDIAHVCHVSSRLVQAAAARPFLDEHPVSQHLNGLWPDLFPLRVLWVEEVEGAFFCLFFAQHSYLLILHCDIVMGVIIPNYMYIILTSHGQYNLT